MPAPTLSVLYQWKQPEGVDGVTRTYAMDHFASEEESIPYSEYREEAQILACVRAGDAARLENVYRALPQTKLGNMSTYPLKRAFYGGIVNTTLVTRAAIEGGLDEKAAFSLSDVYIRHMARFRWVRTSSAPIGSTTLSLGLCIGCKRKAKQPLVLCLRTNGGGWKCPPLKA